MQPHSVVEKTDLSDPLTERQREGDSIETVGQRAIHSKRSVEHQEAVETMVLHNKTDSLTVEKDLPEESDLVVPARRDHSKVASPTISQGTTSLIAPIRTDPGEILAETVIK